MSQLEYAPFSADLLVSVQHAAEFAGRLDDDIFDHPEKTEFVGKYLGLFLAEVHLHDALMSLNRSNSARTGIGLGAKVQFNHIIHPYVTYPIEISGDDGSHTYPEIIRLAAQESDHRRSADMLYGAYDSLMKHIASERDAEVSRSQSILLFLTVNMMFNFPYSEILSGFNSIKQHDFVKRISDASEMLRVMHGFATTALEDLLGEDEENRQKALKFFTDVRRYTGGEGTMQYVGVGIIRRDIAGELDCMEYYERLDELVDTYDAADLRWIIEAIELGFDDASMYKSKIVSFQRYEELIPLSEIESAAEDMSLLSLTDSFPFIPWTEASGFTYRVPASYAKLRGVFRGSVDTLSVIGSSLSETGTRSLTLILDVQHRDREVPALRRIEVRFLVDHSGRIIRIDPGFIEPTHDRAFRPSVDSASWHDIAAMFGFVHMDDINILSYAQQSLHRVNTMLKKSRIPPDALAEFNGLGNNHQEDILGVSADTVSSRFLPFVVSEALIYKVQSFLLKEITRSGKPVETHDYFKFVKQLQEVRNEVFDPDKRMQYVRGVLLRLSIATNGPQKGSAYNFMSDCLRDWEYAERVGTKMSKRILMEHMDAFMRSATVNGAATADGVRREVSRMMMSIVLPVLDTDETRIIVRRHITTVLCRALSDWNTVLRTEDERRQKDSQKQAARRYSGVRSVPLKSYELTELSAQSDTERKPVVNVALPPDDTALRKLIRESALLGKGAEEQKSVLDLLRRAVEALNGETDILAVTRHVQKLEKQSQGYTHRVKFKIRGKLVRLLCHESADGSLIVDRIIQRKNLDLNLGS